MHRCVPVQKFDRIMLKKPVSNVLLLICCCLLGFVKQKPTVYLIGDSTVATGSASGNIQGWGGMLYEYLDTVQVAVRNRAIAGTSSRTYYTQGVHDAKMKANGMWQGVLATLQKGDYVIMQFGHNDESPVVDSTRCRGSIKGIGEDTVEVFNPFLHRQETVHSFGWYLEQFIIDTKHKGAIPVVCSAIPKNKWVGDKIARNSNDYGKWAAAVAKRHQVLFIDLNALAADTYDAAGKVKTTATWFVADNVHTTAAGARNHARLVATVIKQWRGCALSEYIINQ